MGTISSHTQLPVWAKAGLDKAEQARRRAERGQAQEDQSLTQLPANSERTVLEVNNYRDQFIELRALDEDPEHDQALGQPGRVLFGGSDISFEGTSLNGWLEGRGTEVLFRQDYQGSQVEYVRLSSDGNFNTGRLNIARPQSSFQISTRPEHDTSGAVPKSEYFGSTTSAAEVLRSIHPDAPEAVFREVFLEGTRSMSQVRSSLLSEFKQEIQDLSAPENVRRELLALCEQPNAVTPHRLTQILQELSRKDRQNSKLEGLTEKAGLWQALEDFPKLKADGITRTSEYYLSPQQLHLTTAARNWDFDAKTGLPIADTVIVGGGPGGLATGYHLSERGTRTVMFEGGKVGQGFSDAGAKSVHQLRTNAGASNLIYTANANQLGVDVSMHRHLPENRKKCDEAREEWSEASGEKLHGESHARGSEVFFPANRNELFEHMSHVAHGLALNYPDTFVAENSPVQSIQKVEQSDGSPHLFKVTTSRGHEVLTRSLVMATGFVGGHGEHARSLELFQQLEDTPGSGVTVLESDHDLFRDHDTIDNELLVFSERLLGRPELRKRIKELPEGSRISVIGGGESAAKGALEALHLNPGLKLDLYTSSALEPYQTQIPTSVIAPEVGEAGLRHKEVAERTLAELKDFGTPVTAETLQELFELESSGRVRIREMGKRFNQSTVEVSPVKEGETTRLRLELRDDEVAQNLRTQREAWVGTGLYGEQPPNDDASHLPQADMVMIAAGYDNKSLQAGPLLRQLEEQGLIELERGKLIYGEDGLSSSKDPMVCFNTAGAVAMASDTAIPARAIRGYRLSKSLEQRLPPREKPNEKIPTELPYPGVETNQKKEVFNWSKEEALRFVDNNGTFPERLEKEYQEVAKLSDPAERASAKLRIDARRAFGGPNSALAALMVRAHEAPESLTPAERLMWERAQRLVTPS